VAVVLELRRISRAVSLWRIAFGLIIMTRSGHFLYSFLYRIGRELRRISRAVGITLLVEQNGKCNKETILQVLRQLFVDWLANLTLVATVFLIALGLVDFSLTRSCAWPLGCEYARYVFRKGKVAPMRNFNT